MTHEQVYTWLVKIMLACVWIVAVCASILFTGFSAGYVTETYARSERCINSACDKPCKVGARFVRHQGCKP